MKKSLATLIILIMFIIGCYQQEEHTSGIEINYPGDYFAFMTNTDREGIARWYIVEKKGNYSWDKEDLEKKVGKLYKLDLQVSKTTGPAYKDEGDMNIEIIESDITVYEEKVEYGKTGTKIKYIYE